MTHREIAREPRRLGCQEQPRRSGGSHRKWHNPAAGGVAVAPCIQCYEAGKEYEHGGLSPQECIMPILTISKAAAPEAPISIESVTWRRMRCNVTVNGAKLGLRADLRAKAGDPATSLVNGGKALGADGTVTFVVADDDREGQGAVVVVVADDGILRAQTGTVVGG